MKKILLVLVFSIVSINSMSLDLWGRGGLVAGVGSEKSEDTSYVVGLELSQGVLGFADVGAGVGYNGNLKFDDRGSDNNVSGIGYDLLPVYAFAKFNIIPMGVKPYVVARAGKTFVINDDTDYFQDMSVAEGGFYGALGVGVELLKSLQGELLYSISQIKNNPNGEDYVQLVSLTIGYNFL